MKLRVKNGGRARGPGARPPKQAQGRDLRECLGENLKSLRRARGWTQSQLAERSSLSQGFLQNLEAGRRWVGPETIRHLAAELGVTQSELFRDRQADSRPDAVTLMRWLGESLNLHLPADFWVKMRKSQRDRGTGA